MHSHLNIGILGIFLLIGNLHTILGVPSSSPSAVLDNLLSNYDKRVHPYQGKKPVTISLTVYILAAEINDVDQEFTVDMYFRQKWDDERLNFKNQTDESTEWISIHSDDHEKIWVPDTFIVNEIRSTVHEFTRKNQLVRIDRNGSVLHSSRVTLTAVCPMDLAMFPFDAHMCPLEIESYASTMKEIIYTWGKGHGSIGLASDAQSPIFSFDFTSAKSMTVQVGTNNYSRSSMEFYFHRSWKGYKHSFFYPLTVFSIVSLITVGWIVNYKIGTVVNLINIGILNIFMAIRSNSSDVRRKISHTTALDTYFCISSGTVLACCVVNVLNLYFETRKPTSTQSIEMSRLHSNDGTDPETGMRSNTDARIPLWETLPSPRGISEGRWKVVYESFIRILQITFKYSHWVIFTIYILSVLWYWSVYPDQPYPEIDETMIWVEQ